MARTLNEIQLALKNEFVKNHTFINDYELDESKTFDEQFSKVSLEAIWIYIVASAIWTHEQLWSLFEQKIGTLIASSKVMSIPWYYNKALEYQDGDDLILDRDTMKYEYSSIDPGKRIVEYVAIREEINQLGVMVLKIYYSGKNKEPLSKEKQSGFETYMRKIGAAGTHFQFLSQNPDTISFTMDVYYNPLVMRSDGALLASSEKTVEKSITQYLSSIEYGGVFYLSKLMDAIQASEGVSDIVIKSVGWNHTDILRRRIDSLSGAFVFGLEESAITYKVDESNEVG